MAETKDCLLSRCFSCFLPNSLKGMNNTFTARNIKVSFNGHAVVHGANLTAIPGRITALLGPNGAGLWRRKARAVVDSDLLTARKLDCVRVLGRGLTNVEIGRELYLEPSTVKTHLSSAMAKVEPVQGCSW